MPALMAGQSPVPQVCTGSFACCQTAQHRCGGTPSSGDLNHLLECAQHVRGRLFRAENGPYTNIRDFEKTRRLILWECLRISWQFELQCWPQESTPFKFKLQPVTSGHLYLQQALNSPQSSRLKGRKQRKSAAPQQVDPIHARRVLCRTLLGFDAAVVHWGPNWSAGRGWKIGPKLLLAW